MHLEYKHFILGAYISFRAQSVTKEDDFDCTICLSPCFAAVESICCGGRLYCEQCVDAITECPICRSSSFQVKVNLFVRRMLKCLEEGCPNCGVNFRKSEILEHKTRLCPKRRITCKARDCEFEGIEEDLLDHLRKDHAKYLIAIASGEPCKNTFRNESVNASVQTDFQDEEQEEEQSDDEDEEEDEEEEDDVDMHDIFALAYMSIREEESLGNMSSDTDSDL